VNISTLEECVTQELGLKEKLSITGNNDRPACARTRGKEISTVVVAAEDKSHCTRAQKTQH